MYTEASNKAVQRYKAKNYKRIPLDVPTGEYEAVKRHCDSKGLKVNGYIRSLINGDLSGYTAKQELALKALLTESQYNDLKATCSLKGYSVEYWLKSSVRRFITSENKPIN